MEDWDKGAGFPSGTLSHVYCKQMHPQRTSVEVSTLTPIKACCVSEQELGLRREQMGLMVTVGPKTWF